LSRLIGSWKTMASPAPRSHVALAGRVSSRPSTGSLRRDTPGRRDERMRESAVCSSDSPTSPGYPRQRERHPIDGPRGARRREWCQVSDLEQRHRGDAGGRAAASRSRTHDAGGGAEVPGRVLRSLDLVVGKDRAPLAGAPISARGKPSW
jgi:hypothetical protein